MAKTLFALALGTLLLAAAGPVVAHWVPADGHKMHWPQLPDEQGWDVKATYPVVLADDWKCSETGPITDIHFWGSWRDVTGDGIGDVGVIQTFQIGIWSDIPDPDGSGPLFSRPGSRIWFGEVSNFGVAPIDPTTLEAWFDPSKDPDVVVPNDHNSYFQYNVFFDQAGLPPFPQVAGTIYWLSISAVLQPGQPLPYEWGWKSTINHFNDDAVWGMDGLFQWQDIYEPPRVNNFSGAINQDGSWGGGHGTNSYGQGWYFYPATNWWNIWFYDNPFTYQHTKVGTLQCMIMPVNPQFPSNVTVAINWSTDAWSMQQPPPTGPPLPGVNEALYIGRQIIFQGIVPPTGIQLTEPFTLQYNPEWVSVDIQGINFTLMNGVITHECYRTSLDLSFVINGRAPTGACCYPAGNCAVLTQPNCLATQGIYMGNGTVCLGDLNGNGVDDACEQVVPTGACCYPSGNCAVATQPACTGSGGFYLGNGTACLGDVNPHNGVDDACEQVLPTGACCYVTGPCVVTTAPACAFTGGIYAGDGTNCNDVNGNGVADICEQYLPTGACCFDNGTCQAMIAANCTQAGGTYAGNGTLCAGDVNGNGVDDACEGVVTMGACCYGDPIMPICVNTTSTVCGQNYHGTWYSGQSCATFMCPVGPTGACCYTNGSCAVVTQSACTSAQGTYMGNGTTCVDADGNGIADICETLEHPKWQQPPDLSPMGMDVRTINNVALADDFQCTQTGLITKVVVYGSWFEDMVPDHNQYTFVLSFHEDIPAVGTDYSRPGPMICLKPFAPGTYRFEPVPTPGLVEGWYDPSQQMYVMPGDHNLFKYTFEIADPCWRQKGTTSNPKVYWLDVQVLGPDGPQWGWKTSPIHWNDDAVWTMGQEPNILLPWMEMRYPPQHPLYPASVDQAFEIYGIAEVDTCALQHPGDFDSDGDIDNSDLAQLTSFVQGIGAPPVVHANGDVNGDCRINSYDVEDLASFLTSGQPVPVACTCREPYPFRDCCIGTVGNVNLDPQESITIGDISVLIDAKFITGTCVGILNCLTEADINQSGSTNPTCDDITIGDISTLIDYLFIGGPDVVILPNCF